MTISQSITLKIYHKILWRLQELAELLPTLFFKSTRTNAHVLLQGQFLSSESYLILHLFFDDFEKDTGIQLKVKPDLENESIIIEYAEPLRPYRPLATISTAVIVSVPGDDSISRTSNA